MKREITEYETNNLHTLSFISWCEFFLNTYKQKKIMLLPEVSKVIWKMIQEDVFNVNYSETAFNELINDIGYRDFYTAMYRMCYKEKQKEEKYVYSLKFAEIDCIRLIGEQIYKFMHRVEELIHYED